MNKNSITCLEKDSQSSRIELSNPALQDIIATDHMVLRKESRTGRLSRTCKSAIALVVLGLIASGVVALTLALAHSRNNLMAASVARSAAEVASLATSNETRVLHVNQENSTTIFTEHKQDNWQTSTVILTSHHSRRLTTPTVHISPSIMQTKQHTYSNARTMKPYPSANTISNEQSSTISAPTVQTTTGNQQTSDVPRSSHHSETIITTDNEFVATQDHRITIESEPLTTQHEPVTTMTDRSDDISVSSNDPMTSRIPMTSVSIQDDTTSMSDDYSLTTFLNHYFHWQSSTMSNVDQTKETTIQHRKTIRVDHDDEDLIDNLLFS